MRVREYQMFRRKKDREINSLNHAYSLDWHYHDGVLIVTANKAIVKKGNDLSRNQK
jgi:hypothetical protein